MTLLLVMEAIDDGRLALEDMVTVSAHAASMGGSQVYLKEEEQMSVDDMLKAVAVVSGNDAAVALAEHLAGSEEAFAARMNERAAQLGMKDTCFVNCTGLPAAGHLTIAYDIAVMSPGRPIQHPRIRDYTTIWMDSIRGGSSSWPTPISWCVSMRGPPDSRPAPPTPQATASRPRQSGTVWNSSPLSSRPPPPPPALRAAKSLLNFGFANYTLIDVRPGQALPPSTCGWAGQPRSSPSFRPPAAFWSRRTR